MFRRMLAIIAVLLVAILAVAGTWTPNNFLYKPGTGARGEAEKKTFENGLDQIDQRLGKEIWVGDPGRGTTLQGAVTGIGGNQAMLRIPAGTWSINANFTIPANVTLKPEQGAILSIANGVTLTVNGSLDAGLNQIFSCVGTGKVVFTGNIARDYPQWFGAVGDGSNDDTAAIQMAIDAVRSVKSMNGMETFFPAGSYKHSGLKVYTGSRLIGAGRNAVRLNNSTTTTDSIGTFTGETLQGAVTVAHLTLYGSTSASAGTGIKLDSGANSNARNSVIDDVLIYGHYNGINIAGFTLGQLSNITIMYAVNDGIVSSNAWNAITLQNCYAKNCGRHGYNVCPNYSSFINCAADNNTGDGYHLFATGLYGLSTSVTFISCGSEYNSGNGLFIELGRHINIQGFDIYGAGGDSIKLSGTMFVNVRLLRNTS